jgi:membrane associated rhomboid family serine protease
MVRLTHSPTVTLLTVFGIIYFVQEVTAIFGTGFAFALFLPLATQPWTLITNIYAHGSLFHLASNAFALALVGFPIERRTSSTRFHTFFLLTGVGASIAQVVVADLFGVSIGVIGASGAIFALFGYVLTSNDLANTILQRVSPRIRAVSVLVLAAIITLSTATPGVALIAHFTGIVIGAVGGRARVLRTPT